MNKYEKISNNNDIRNSYDRNHKLNKFILKLK